MQELLREYVKQILTEGIGPFINIKLLKKMLKYMIDNNLYTTSRRKKKDLPAKLLAKVEQNLDDLKNSQKGEKIIFYISSSQDLDAIYETLTKSEREWVDSQFKTKEKYHKFFEDFFFILAGASKRGVLGTYIVDRSGLSIVSSRFGLWQKSYGSGWMQELPNWLNGNYNTLIDANSTFVHEFQHFIQDKLYTGKLNNPDASEHFEELDAKEFEFLNLYLNWFYRIDLKSDKVKQSMFQKQIMDGSKLKVIELYNLSSFQGYKALLSNNDFRMQGDVTDAIVKYMKRYPRSVTLKDIKFLATYLPPELGQQLISQRVWTEEMTKYFFKKHHVRVKMAILNESSELQSFYTQSSYRTGGFVYGKCQFFKRTKKHKDFAELRKGNNPNHFNKWGQLATEYDATVAESVLVIFQRMCDARLGYTGMQYPMMADALLDGDFEEFKTLFNQRAKLYSKQHGIDPRNIDNNPQLKEKLERSVEYIYESFMEYIDDTPPPNTDKRFESTEFNEWFGKFYLFVINK